MPNTYTSNNNTRRVKVTSTKAEIYAEQAAASARAAATSAALASQYVLEHNKSENSHEDIRNQIPYAVANGDISVDEIYNLEEDIRNGNAVVIEDNAVVTSSLKYVSMGGYQLSYNQSVISPNFKKGLLHNKWLQEYFNTANVNNTIHKQVNFTDLLRKYSILKRECKFTGLNQNYYNSDMTERLSYARVFIPDDGIKWFVPITMYEVEFKGYDENNAYIGSLYAYTDKTGETVSTDLTFAERLVGFENYLGDYYSILNTFKGRMGATSVTAVYTGKTYPNLFLWLIDDWSSDYYVVDTVDNQRDYNSGARYREIRPMLNCDTWLQEIKDTDGNIAYTDYNNWVMFSPWGGNADCYNNPLGSTVPSDANVYSDLLFTTTTNNGNYKFTHKCFYVPQQNSNDYKAKKCWEIYNSLNDGHYWTSTAPTTGDVYANCHGCDDRNDVASNEWRDFTKLWYTVQKGENTYYVLTSDITDTPEVGGYVPTGIQLYNNRMTDEQADTAGENDTTFTDVTPTYTCSYTSQTCFIYNYNEQWGEENIAQYEKYFSNNSADWGIWELNENNERTTKVATAYQWHCNMAYELDNYFVVNVFPASGGEFAPVFDVNNYYWWVMKVWEVKSNLTEQIAYCPFKGTAGATTQEHCLTSAGLEAVLPDGEKWVYTGGFNGDFLGRYTKLQNGEL